MVAGWRERATAAISHAHCGVVDVIQIERRGRLPTYGMASLAIATSPEERGLPKHRLTGCGKSPPALSSARLAGLARQARRASPDSTCLAQLSDVQAIEALLCRNGFSAGLLGFIFVGIDCAMSCVPVQSPSRSTRPDPLPKHPSFPSQQLRYATRYRMSYQDQSRDG